MSQTNYRADIDGLRAVAVLAVVVFHARPGWLPGGFTGVDMFFVISGYLISGIIYRAQRENTFTYADFYARRVRRIFPALIAAIALCLAYGWLVLLPAEYEQLGRHAAAGTVFLQNVAFWRESDYFDTAATLKPLLHLWSLAVEEQIYLVFPPLVLFVLRMRWPLTRVFAILLVASFVANLVMAHRAVSTDFFLTPFRAWEFLAGAILARIDDRRSLPSAPSWPGESPASRWLAEAASWAGIAILSAGLAWIDEREPYPGWRALVPVIGTLLVIAAGREASFNRIVLSLAPVVWIGLISYPLYLFHWPLISFVHIVEGADPDPRIIAAAVALSTAFAVVTYYGLEKHIRHSRWRWTVPLLVAGFLAVGAAGFGIWKGHIPAKPLPVAARQVNQAMSEWPPVGEYGFFKGFRKSTIDGITRSETGGKGPQTLFLGDCQACMIAPRILRLLEDRGPDDRGAVFVTSGASFPVPGAYTPEYPESKNLISVFERELSVNPAIDRVVISAFWLNYFSKNSRALFDGLSTGSDKVRARALEAFEAMIAKLVRSGKEVTVVLAVPSDARLDPKSMTRRGFFGASTLAIEPYPVEEFLKNRRTVFADLERAAKDGGAKTIDPLEHLVLEGICIAVDENGPIRSDAVHLRPSFVRDHVTYLDSAVTDGPAALSAVHPASQDEPIVPPAVAMPPGLRLVTQNPARATLASGTDGSTKVDIESTGGDEAWRIQLRSSGVAIRSKERYRLSFRARAEKARTIVVTVSQNRSPWQAVGLFTKVDLTSEWQDYRFEFQGKIDEADALLRFNLGGSDVAVEIADVIFRPAGDR